MLEMIQGSLDAIMRNATPLVLTALGGMYTARAGILNFSLEGIMIIGAFNAVWGSYLTGSPWFGLVLAMAGGLLMSLILGFCSITAKVNQVVAGTGINVLGLGLSSYLNNLVYGYGVQPTNVASFKPIAIPLLSDIPVIGDMIFNQTVLTYIMYGVIIISWFVIFKTPFGLSLRAIGDSPHAAASLGINVDRRKYQAVVLSGILGGIGGAYLSVGALSSFLDGMTSGRGYLAWGVVTVGKWNPFGILAAGLVFGAGESLQMRLQSLGVDIPYQFLVMVPYLLTLLVMNGFIGKTEAPHALGVPYIKGEK